MGVEMSISGSVFRGRRLRATVSVAAILAFTLQPMIAEGKSSRDEALNVCSTERAPLVKLDDDYREMKRSKMASAIGEGLKKGAAVIATGVMNGGLTGGRSSGFTSGLGGFGSIAGAIGGLAAAGAAQQQAASGAPAAAPNPAGMMFGQDMLSGALGLNVPGISNSGFSGGDNMKAYAALAVLVAIVATAEAYAQLKEQEAGGDLRKASYNIDQDAARQLAVAREVADSGNALVECRSRQLSDINTRLAGASNDKDRKAIRRERTELIGALKKDVDLTGEVVDQHAGMAKTFTQGRAMTDGASEADVLGGQAPAYAEAPSTSRLAMPKASGGAPAQAAAPAPAAPAPTLVAIRSAQVRAAPVGSAAVLSTLPPGREITPTASQAVGGWWEVQVGGSSGYVRAADLGPQGSAPVEVASNTKGKAKGKGPPPRAAAAPPAVAGPTNIRAYNQTVIAARENGKGRLSSLMTDIQTSQRRDSILYAVLERFGLA